MPDIALRFHKDMLVLSSPVAVVLARQGFDVEHDLEFANLVEPEAVRDALRLNKMAGAQCLVANTEGIAPARLAHRGMEDRAAEIVRTGLSLARELKSQHVLVEIGPCGLSLDAASKSSLNENRDQYARAARACDAQEFDAFFLNGFANPADLKCALMGVRQVSGAPVFASVDVDADGMLADGRHTFEDALAVMVDYEASVVGFATAAPLDAAVTFARRASGAGRLPVLAQLIVREHNPKQGDATHENACGRRPVPACGRCRHAGLCRRARGGQRRVRRCALGCGGVAWQALTRCAARITERCRMWWIRCTSGWGRRRSSAASTSSWPPRPPIFPTTWPRSSTCCRPAATRASAYATS